MGIGWGKAKKWVMFGVVIGLLWMAGAERAWAQMIFQAYSKPQAAVEFSLTDLQGKRVESRESRGQVIFLNFWATW